ncbi:hypothetical protein BDN70DRAFT_895310 [Pholiota conissans]|uniref:C3H1-type domain-containing protein n=1 Tax=Pholiota conissans TaxID=109636 RepID=A0A9P6D024_9AGAR|nr:hypothetical protein BDN70DRAFT_895310 [Pholiota conissans]
MPSEHGTAHDSDRDRDRERDRDRDRDRDNDRGASKSKSAAASSKTKDLSHVPCKFFKVGGCTAGSSCPFSHSSAEPGGQKETCTWFVKGNCKFGHKCALAHILPGQSPAMDRKNKKAAQAAAALASGNTPGGGDREKAAAKSASARSRREQGANGSSPGANRLPLLGVGSTAPTRSVGGAGSGAGGRHPLGVPLKASISPSAPAPPLKDTDFAAFATLDEMEGIHQQSSSRASTEQERMDDERKNAEQPTEDATNATTTSRSTGTVPMALPPSAPRSSAVTTAPVDFGPIGSPPNYRGVQPTSPTRANGTAAFSPGTSPRHATHINGVNIHSSASPAPQGAAASSAATLGLLSTSPFSAPGAQSVFLSSSSYGAGAGGGFGGLGMAASLGSGLTMMGGRKGWGDGSEVGSVGAAGGQSTSFSGLLSAQLSSSLATQSRATPVNGYSGRAGEYDISVEYDDFGGTAGLRRGLHLHQQQMRGREFAVEDEEMEDFLPSSLTELLTPEERSRRMSRSHSGQPPAGVGGISQLSRELAAGSGVERDSNTIPTSNNNGGMGHRHSRSVPAPSLLGDIKSIWSDNSTAGALPASPSQRGGYSSSRFDPYGGGNLSSGLTGTFADNDALSMSVGSAAGAGAGGAGSSYGMTSLSPSNASAAFLPGLHHHYMNSKAKSAQQVQQQQQQQQAGLGLGLGGIGRQMRGASGPLYAGQGQGAAALGQGNGNTNNTLAGNYMSSGLGLGLPASATSSAGFHTHIHGGTQTTYRTPSSPFDLTQTLHQQQNAQPQGLSARLAGYGTYGGGGAGVNTGAGVNAGANSTTAASHLANEEALLAPHIMSPGARALQAHAPGQSLPQGLAAGYSRIHALPPLTHLALSPPAGGEDGFGPGGPSGDWGATPTTQGTPGSANAGATGLEGRFSRLSYSAAARGAPATGAGAGAGTPPPPGLTRNVSAGRYAQGPLSPLSRPVVTRDDDDELFDMDK